MTTNAGAVEPITPDRVQGLVQKGLKLSTYMLVHESGRLVERIRADGHPPYDTGKISWDRSHQRTTPLNVVHEDWTVEKNLPAPQGRALHAFDSIRYAVSTLGVRLPGEGSESWAQFHTIDSQLRPNGKMFPVRWKQDKRHQDVWNGVAREATDAFLSALFNPVDGIIILQEMRSPYDVLSGREALDDWARFRFSRMSDIIYLQWAHMHAGPSAHHRYYSGEFNCFINGESMPSLLLQSDRLKQNLHYVVVNWIRQPETLQVIMAVVKSRLWQSTAEARKPYWEQRMTFPIGSWQFYALLATKGSSSIAWMLAEHKNPKQVGHKGLHSVTLWWPQPMQGHEVVTDFPNLLWEVVDIVMIRAAGMGRTIKLNAWRILDDPESNLPADGVTREDEVRANDSVVPGFMNTDCPYPQFGPQHFLG